MRYVSIDIETLGLNPEYCDVIEFAAVLDNLKDPIDDLPTFHCYVLPPSRSPNDEGKRFYQGEPFAMAMHADKLKRIATFEAGYSYREPHMVGRYFAQWLKDHDYVVPYQPLATPANWIGKPVEIVVAGKNFASFDWDFLARMKDFESLIKIHHRVIDVSVLFLNHETDDALPSTDECIKRSRALIGYGTNHEALGDALNVVRLFRTGLGVDLR